jgi:DNA-binding transcriptional regulator YdaS (Cro superfamily)
LFDGTAATLLGLSPSETVSDIFAGRRRLTSRACGAIHTPALKAEAHDV